MKIIRLEAENLKRLVAIDITPEGHIVELTGENGSGKTSILDAIWWALDGTANIQSRPVRQGEEKARIRLDLGDLIVTRRFTAQEAGGFTTSVVVENAEGARYPSPQAMLDALVGSLSFDPIDFTRMSPKVQLERLKQITGLDFAAMEKANDEDFRARTATNRRARELRAVAASKTLPADAVILEEPADEDGLIQQLRDAADTNSDLERRRANREAAESKIILIQADIGRLTDEMHELQQRLAKAPALGEPIDTAVLADRLGRAREANRLLARKQELDTLVRQAEGAEREANELTAKMDERAAEKRKLIETAKMPVEGLGFGDDYITLNGQPFEQASDAEQLRASVAIAGAMNPKLRVIRVRDGSLLDEASMTLLAGYAAEHDLQVWIETVSSGRPGAIVIEDGQIAPPKMNGRRNGRRAKDDAQGELLP